jgi:hypothetical protein
LVEAIKFERAKHEAVKYGNTEADANTLCAAVAAYREAMVAEPRGASTMLGKVAAIHPCFQPVLLGQHGPDRIADTTLRLVHLHEERG